jgi:hypothetical protein
VDCRYNAISTAIMQDLDVDPSTPITGDMEGRDVAMVVLANTLLKKREVWPQDMIATQEARALELFLESNSACQQWSWKPDHVMDDLFVGELRSFLAELCDPQHEPDLEISLSSLAQGMGPGPGAARMANAENFFTKLFASKMTATSEYLLSLYRAACCERPFWAEAEFSRHQLYGFQQVSGSAYFSVPKNAQIQRSCATEPNINMLFQKALGDWLADRLKGQLCLDLADQQYINQKLAREGSISGHFGTIDLKSASDRNSMAMIEYFFPPRFVKWLKLFRSPTCLLPSGQELKMEMCSSMGNGFTFPLQTALFVGVVAVCYKLLGISFKKNRRVKQPAASGEVFKFDQRKLAGNFGVFGDDIIVQSDAYDYVARQLSKLGHVVNDQKSFNTGGFRESCGADYFYGYNTRGVYVRSLETPLDVYSAINRLTRWSAAHGVNLSSSIRLLMGWVKFLPVPFSSADIEGIKVPYDATRTIRIRNSERRVEADSRDWQCFLYRGVHVQNPGRKVDELSRDETSSEAADSPASCEAGWAVSALGGYAGTPPYRLDVPQVDNSTIFNWPKYQPVRGRPSVVIGVRSPDEVIRWKVKLKTATCWPTAPKLPGPIIGLDRGTSWEGVAGNHEINWFLSRVMT